jgi:hypothetical protein
MMNLGYNIRRLVQLERMAAAPAGVRAASCKRTARSPASVKTVSPWHERCNPARSARAEITESGYCSRSCVYRELRPC